MTDVERRLSQHDNELVAVYGLIEDLRREQRERFDELDAKLRRHDTTLEAHTQLLQEILRRLPESS